MNPRHRPSRSSAAIAPEAARVIVTCAPPGYRKIDTLRAFGRTGRVTVCELDATGSSDIARCVLDAMLSNDKDRIERFAADRLMQPRDAAAATSREVLRREWASAADEGLFIFHDAASVFTTRPGADLLAELLAAAPATKRIGIAVREPLGATLTNAVTQQRSLLVGPDDLALSIAEVRSRARAAGLGLSVADDTFGVARGWPMVTELLLQLGPEGESRSVLETAARLPTESLLPFTIHRRIAMLDTMAREVLAVVALAHGATHRDVARVLGEACDDAVLDRVARLPFVALTGDMLTLHPAALPVLRTRFHAFFTAMRERTLRALSSDGEPMRAVQIALDAGEVEKAASIAESAPPYTSSRMNVRDYERIIERVDPDIIVQFPNLWVATIPYRAFSIDVGSYVREAETVYFCLPASATTDQRAAIVMILASAYVNVGRPEDADRVIDDALAGFASGPCTARASILNFTASLRGIEGRFSAARELAAQAGAISRDAFGESQVLHYIESHEAAYRGQQRRMTVIIDELLRRRRRDALPLYVAYVAASGATFSWANGDDETCKRYLTELEDSITPGLEAELAAVLDAARGREQRVLRDDRWPSVAAMTHLYRMGNAATHEEAVEAARSAAAEADRRRDPYLQTLAHTATFVLDESAHEAEGRALLAIVEPVESPELHEAVRALVAGEPAGMLDTYVRRRVLRGREELSSRICVQLIGARVVRGGSDVRLTDKEFEFLALLSSTHGPLSRERIGEALWEHLDPQEWRNNVKVHVHRLRTKLGSHEAVLFSGGRYRMGSNVDVDLRPAEAFVRSLRPGELDPAARARCRLILDDYRASAGARYDGFGWAHTLAARLMEVAVSAGIALAWDAHARKEPDSALSVLDEVRDIDALNERACEVLVRLLLAKGDVDAARREVSRYTVALAREFGSKPSTQLLALVRPPR